MQKERSPRLAVGKAQAPVKPCSDSLYEENELSGRRVGNERENMALFWLNVEGIDWKFSASELSRYKFLLRGLLFPLRRRFTFEVGFGLVLLRI